MGLKSSDRGGHRFAIVGKSVGITLEAFKVALLDASLYPIAYLFGHLVDLGDPGERVAFVRHDPFADALLEVRASPRRSDRSADVVMERVCGDESLASDRRCLELSLTVVDSPFVVDAIQYRPGGGSNKPCERMTEPCWSLFFRRASEDDAVGTDWGHRPTGVVRVLDGSCRTGQEVSDEHRITLDECLPHRCRRPLE